MSRQVPPGGALAPPVVLPALDSKEEAGGAMREGTGAYRWPRPPLGCPSRGLARPYQVLCGGGPTMIDRDSARSEGFTGREIDLIEAYCLNMQRRGKFSNRAALVHLPESGIVWVCQTVAQGIERLRPGSWLREKDEMETG